MDRKFDDDFERNAKDWKRGSYVPNGGQVDSKSVNSMFQEQKYMQKSSNNFDQQAVPEAKGTYSYQSSPFVTKKLNEAHSSPYSGLQNIQNQNESITKGASIAASCGENVKENTDCDVENELELKEQEILSIGKEIDYKYRGELVSAKITRIRLDGTYDILLSNGLRQLCVSKKSIRCKPSKKVATTKTLESNNITLKSSINETNEGKNTSDVLSVGCSVECRFRGKSKYYRATVQKVNNNGTYDLLYEDGDREFRVARDLIRSQNNQAENSKKKSNHAVGVRDDANKTQISGLQFGCGKSSVQESFDLNGRNNIAEIDDVTNKDNERNEDENNFINVGSEIGDDKDEELKLGSHVECRYRGKSKYYPATIKRVHGNGTYDLLYEDGDREFRVAKDLIKAKKPIGNTSNQSSSVVQEDRHLDNRLGNKAPTKSSSFTEATVNSSMHEKVDYKDEDVLIGQEELTVGNKVECRYKGKTKFYPAIIKKVNGNGTFDLLYDDGDREFQVSRDLIRATKSIRTTTKKTLDSLGKISPHQNNACIRSTMKTDNTSFGRKAQTTSSLGKNTSDLDIEERSDTVGELNNHSGQAEEDSSDSSQNSDENIIEYVVGSQIECRYRGKSKYYPATIKRKHSNDTYDLLYEDGDREFRVAKELIRPKKPLSSTTKKQNRMRNLSEDGKTRDKNLSGSQMKPSPPSGNGRQYDLDQNSFNDFNDYDFNSKVNVAHDDNNNSSQKAFLRRSLSKSIPTMDKEDDKNSVLAFQRSSNDDINNENCQLSDGRTTATKADALFKLGSRVKARFQGGKNFYPGVITAVRQNGSSYDIKYDDGDMEQNVSRDMFRNISNHEEEPPISLSEEDGMNRNTKQLKNNTFNELIVGSRIEARFRGGNKFYPGIITSCQDDSTYSVLYDDGDREHGVKKTNIRLLCEGDAVVEGGDSGDASNEETHFQKFVGKIVEARFKGNDEWYQGDVLEIQHDGAIVIKLHSRGTFLSLSE